MSTAQLWTILGVMLVVFVALGTTMVTLFLHMDKKIDAQGDKIEKLALAQAEMNGILIMQGNKIDAQGDKTDAQGDKIEKLALAQAEMNGRLETVLAFLPHPQESSAAV